jgi:hypothetical protein
MGQSERTLLALAAAALAVVLSGCGQKQAEDGAGPAEKVGKQVDQAASRAGEELDKFAGKLGQGMEKAGQKLQDEASQARKDQPQKDQ